MKYATDISSFKDKEGINQIYFICAQMILVF